MELLPPPPRVLNHGSFHPLIWSKLEAARATDIDVVVVLDPDQIMYRSLHQPCAALWASTADFGACTDNETVAAQFRRVPPALDPYAKRPGISSGTMLIRPSLDFYDAYVDAARRYAADALYPDQSVLDILAYPQGRWLRFEEELQFLNFSPSVPDPGHGSCLGWTIFAATPGGGSATGAAVPAAVGTTVDAPHLGLFVAGTAVGETVAVDDPLGFLRVLNEERPVDRTVSGRVTALLVADGATVEFGTPLIGLAAH